MDEKRMGEIALALIQYRIQQEGLRLGASFGRDLGNIAKETGISIDELKEFYRFLVEETVKKTFGS